MQDISACHICAGPNNERHERCVAQAIIDRIEAERAKIARDIHDQAGQLLISAEFCLDLALSKLPEGLVAREWIAQARQSLDEGRDELHRLAFDLRPRILDDFGLIPALRSFLAQYGKLVDVELETELAEPPGKLAPALELALFRILQESLINAHKHSQASHISVRLSFERAHVQLEISDNGIGFDSDELDANDGAHQLKLGLLGLRERAVALGGELRIVSRPAEGTSIQARLPLI